MNESPETTPSTDEDRSFEIPPPPSPETGASKNPPPISGGPRSYNPPPPKKPRRGRWVLLAVTILLIGFFGLVALLLVGGLIIGGGSAGTGDFRETELESGTTGKKVVVIPVQGIITSQPTGLFGGSATTDTIRKRLEMALKDQLVAAIILDVNSPGGEVTATDEIHHLLQTIRKQRQIPIITCMRSVAASGGYYLAAGTDHIVANRLTMTGSIGVVIGGMNYSKLLEKIGIEGKVFKSGPMKDMGSPARRSLNEIADYRLELKRRVAKIGSASDALSIEELALIRDRLKALDEEEKIVRQETELFQNMVDDCFGEFARVVADGRGIPLETVMDRNGEIGNARVISGADAHRLKLVDELGFMEDAIAFARKTGNHAVVTYDRVPGLFSMLTGRATGPKTSMIKELLPEEFRIVKKGRLYYLNPNLF